MDDKASRLGSDMPALVLERLSDLASQPRYAVSAVAALARDYLEGLAPGLGRPAFAEPVPPGPGLVEVDADAVLDRHAVQVDLMRPALRVHHGVVRLALELPRLADLRLALFRVVASRLAEQASFLEGLVGSCERPRPTLS